MKNFLSILFLFSLLLFSCSSNDSSNNESEILIKKIVSVSNGNSYETTFSYNGDQLNEIVIGSNRLKYTYLNNNITNIKRYSSGLFQSEIFLEYDSQQRVSSELYIDYLTSTSEKTFYTYNSDNTVSLQKYFGDTISSQPNIGNSGIIYNDSNGETYKIENFNQGNLANKTVWAFDNKNNPLKNIIGYNKQPTILGKFFNNISTENFDSTNAIISNSTFNYTYNSNNFPESCVQDYYDNGVLQNSTAISYFY